MSQPRPFSRYEFMIAWRYLRARRAEGGVSVMTWISLIGIALGVMALIATLAVRAGFRAEFVDTITGANPHVTLYPAAQQIENPLTEEIYTVSGKVEDYQSIADRVAKVDGVSRAAALVHGQVMVSFGDRSNVAEVFGLSLADLKAIPRIADPAHGVGQIDDFDKGIAIGSGIAHELGVGVGDVVRLIAPEGASTPMGTTPRVGAYEVVYIFTAGRYDIDRTRVYMPLSEAQSYFNRDSVADQVEVMVDSPEQVDRLVPALLEAAGPGFSPWTWRDSSGAFLRALDIEDNVMFVILAVLVLIAAMNITSGLIMLVKNKGRDIGILRTMGLTEGAILRVFFLCGAFTGIIGTLAGVVLGVTLSLNVGNIMHALSWIKGADVWDPSVRGIYELPAKLQLWDVVRAVLLSLTLSFIVTIFPARRAARLNPVEALRYE